MDNQASKASNINRFELKLSKWALLILAGIYVIILLAQISVAAGWLKPAPISSLLNSYKEIALPVITLILGHYFGTRSKSISSGK